MSKTLRTSGDLREFLSNVMLGVKNGDIKLDEASRITKLAAQINESIYSEVKTAKLRHELGEQVHAMGELPINK